MNFPLVLVILRTLLRLNGCITQKRRCVGTDQKKEKETRKVELHLLFDSLKIQSSRLTCSFPDNFNCADFKVNCSLTKSNFLDELINLNFLLFLVILQTLLRLSGRTTKKRRCHGTDSKKKSNQKSRFRTWYSILWKLKVTNSLALFQIT